jgi:flagellar motility protein MotE (MotC chaperone)
MNTTNLRRSVMRKIIKKLTLLAAALMIMAVPALADEGSMDKTFDQGQQDGKNECLLVAMNCANQVDTIQQRINRIQGEVSRGTSVYSNEELKALERELEDANKLLDNETVGG